MFVSVIIPTCNRLVLLSKCLDSLHAEFQKTGDYSFEVIVTDDSKNNKTEKLIADKYQWVTWIKGPARGPAANRNSGAKHAKGDWLIFLDDDIIPGSALIAAYEEGINANPGFFAFEGAIFPDDENLLKMDMAECPVNTNGGYFWSANICINANLFKKIGGFNEIYIIAAQEDQQMKIDIQKNGTKILFIRKASVIHPVRFTSIKKQVQQIPAVSRNFCFYAYKNKDLLGYTSVPKFFFSQCSFHFKAIIKLFKQRKLKSSLVSFIFLIYCVPLNGLNFYFLNRRSDAKHYK